MNQSAQLLLAVKALTSRLDDIQNNAKTIPELVAQTALVLSSKIPVHNNGSSENITVQQIVDAVSVANGGLPFITVTASRDFLATDNGKTLIVKSAGVVLSMPVIALPTDFNCCIKPLTGYDATLDFTTYTYDAPNGLAIAENEMVSIGFDDSSTFIVSP